MGEAFQTHLHLSRLQKYPSFSLHIHGPGNESEGSSDHLHESNSFIIIIFIIIDILEYLPGVLGEEWNTFIGQDS